MITSPKNPRIVAAAKLKKRAGRDHAQRFLVEGAQVVGEALAAGIPLECLYVSDADDPLAVAARAAGIPVEGVDPSVMGALASTVTPQGVVGISPAVAVELDALLQPTPNCIAILSSCRDPGNAGTVVRSALAAGTRGVIFSDTSVDPYNPKTVRASAGALFHLAHVRGVSTVDAIDVLRGDGYEIVAGSAEGGEDLFDASLAERTAFLFGNEAWGLPPDVARLADRTVRIPLQTEAESLNLATAATLCLYEWRRKQAVPKQTALVSFDRIIAAAAHDLRSPAAGIRSFASTLLGRELDPETTRMLLEGIAFDADRMGLVVQQLVDAARLAAGDLEPLNEPGDVVAILSDLVLMLAGNPDHPEVRWVGPPSLALSFDRGRMRVALAAFIELAVWFANRGPITVDGTLADGFLELTVTRAGATVELDSLEELFAPRAAGSGGGSKLGPFVARSTARAMGGDAYASIVDGALRMVLRQPTPS